MSRRASSVTGRLVTGSTDVLQTRAELRAEQMGDSCVGRLPYYYVVDVIDGRFVRVCFACLKRPVRAHFSWARVFGADIDVGNLGARLAKAYPGQFLPDGNK